MFEIFISLYTRYSVCLFVCSESKLLQIVKLKFLMVNCNLKMDKSLNEFLSDEGFPNSFSYLLPIAGYRSLKDLDSFDNSQIEDLEKFIRESLKNFVELNEKSTRMKYLGFDCKDVGSFVFPPGDKRKLMRIESAVAEKLQKIEQDKNEILEKKRRHCEELSKEYVIVIEYNFRKYLI
jgi:hypothetical protein